VSPALAEAPPDCPLCPRLVAYREENAAAEPDWFNGAVPSFGPPDGDTTVELLIIGLAPGRSGANRTGRPFTGDWAGDLLYGSLIRKGVAYGSYEKHAGDSLALRRTMITNAVRCVPPQNKPIGAEVNQCRNFLTERIHSLPNVKTLFCLGKVSHDATLRSLGMKVAAMPFGHDTCYDIEIGGRPAKLRSSYHCSRYNTSTKRLTEDMFDHVVGQCASDIGLG